MRDLRNVSSLINSLSSTGGAGSSFNLAEYSLIKNGSYGKLMKAYYAKDSSATSSATGTDKTSKTDKTTKKDAASSILNGTALDTASNKALSTMRSEAEGLKSAAESLASDKLWKQTGSEVSDEVVKAVQKYASEYNDVIKQADKVTASKVTSSVNTMKNMTSVMSNSLGKIGITVDTDGKLSVDADALKSANIKDVKSLLSGGKSYAGQMMEYATSISSAATMSASLYNQNGTLNSSLTGMFSTNI